MFGAAVDAKDNAWFTTFGPVMPPKPASLASS